MASLAPARSCTPSTPASRPIIWPISSPTPGTALSSSTPISLRPSQPCATAFPPIPRIIVLDSAAPESIPDAIPFDAWIADADGDFAWAPGPETDACGICYTSGTTGNPKGVAYTHRSNTLHALTAVAPDTLGLSSRETIMPVVPLFHANGWAIPYAAPLTGAGLVLPGRDMRPASLYELLESGVTVTAAVPTVWMALLAYLDANSLGLSSLRRVVIGGASCPRAVIERFQDTYGVAVLHAWGMTETSPLGTVCSFKPEIAARDAQTRLTTQETVGHPPFTVDLEIVGETGAPVPHDGHSQGTLLARGPAVVGRYLHADVPAIDTAGWFETGDVATITPEGYVRITDRTKDVIKSGGEWISSIALENAAIAHPGVAEAAAVGLAHPRWGERPVLVIVARPGARADPAGITDLLVARFPAWQRPDLVLFRDALPHTATGKVSKLALRAQLRAEGVSLAPPDTVPAPNPDPIRTVPD